MKVVIRNRQEAETDNPIKNNHIVVSVYTIGDEPPKIVRNDFTKDIIQLAFDDLDRDSWGDATEKYFGRAPILFNESMAQQIIDFVGKYPDALVVVHCDAGISRSSGIAAALCKYYNSDDNWIFDDPRYSPNMLVYSTLLKLLYN